MTSTTVVTSIATEKGMTAGVSGDSIAAIAPSLELQFVANDSVEVERQSKSWRKGVSIEDCKHAHSISLACAFIFRG